MIFTRDFVTRENHWQITSLVTKKSLFTVTHALFFISSTSQLVLPIDIENPYRLSNCLYRYISIYIGFLATNF